MHALDRRASSLNGSQHRRRFSPDSVTLTESISDLSAQIRRQTSFCVDYNSTSLPSDEEHDTSKSQTSEFRQGSAKNGRGVTIADAMQCK